MAVCQYSVRPEGEKRTMMERLGADNDWGNRDPNRPRYVMPKTFDTHGSHKRI